MPYEGPDRRRGSDVEDKILEKIHDVNDSLIRLESKMEYATDELQKNSVAHAEIVASVNKVSEDLSSIKGEAGILKEKITSHIDSHGRIVGVALTLVGLVGAAFGWAIDQFTGK